MWGRGVKDLSRTKFLHCSRNDKNITLRQIALKGYI